MAVCVSFRGLEGLLCNAEQELDRREGASRPQVYLMATPLAPQCHATKDAQGRKAGREGKQAPKLRPDHRPTLRDRKTKTSGYLSYLQQNTCV